MRNTLSISRLFVVVPLLLFLSGCGSDSLEIELDDNSSWSSPLDIGTLSADKGTRFKFYSNYSGVWEAVVAFRVPAAATYAVQYQGRDAFSVAIRLKQMGAALLAPAHGVVETVQLEPDISYFLVIEQIDTAQLGASSVTIWAD